MLLERYWIFNVVPMNQYIYKIKKKVSVDFFLSFLNLFLSAFFFFFNFWLLYILSIKLYI